MHFTRITAAAAGLSLLALAGCSLFGLGSESTPAPAGVGYAVGDEPLAVQAGASILAAAYVLPLFYLTWSLFRGAQAPANPWGATGLEWQTPSPPPTDNFVRTPSVTRPPYDYPKPTA